jgi:PAS domain S-box-containing protein
MPLQQNSSAIKPLTLTAASTGTKNSPGTDFADETQYDLLSADDIVDTVRESLLVLTADLRVRKANRAFCRTFQVSPADTVGQLIYDLGNKQWDIPWLRRLLQEVCTAKTSFDDFEVEHCFPAIGRKFMVLNARRVRQPLGKTELILLAIEDVTEQRLAEGAKHTLETRYTSLVQNIRDHAIFMMDVSGVITTWNAEAQAIIGYDEAEIVGRNFSIIFNPEDLARGIPEHELRRAREVGRAKDERWHVRKNGDRFWALGIVTPMHDADGKLVGFSKILRDMTERKQAEQKLAEQAEALREADLRKDEFLATLAHELRNPLAPIHSALQILSLSNVDAASAKRSLSMIERQVRNMERLVDDLLDVARVVRGKIELRRERVELATVIAQAVETVQPVIDALGHRLAISIAEQSLAVDADPLRLAQAVGNLLTNAAKYTDRNGRIYVTAASEGPTAVIRIRDNGIGISPEMQPRIFELFVQVDHAAKRSQGGLGIGLPLVKNLVELHGGGVAVASEGLGCGSEFEIRLPLAIKILSLPDVAAPPEQRPTSSPGAFRILIVDDNQDAALSLAMLLRFQGHEVRVAYDGSAALELATPYRPDVVLLDLGMPGMDGFEVARRWRSMPGSKSTVLAALTGWGQTEDRTRTTAAGFDHHLVKPVDLKDLEKLFTSFASGENGAASRRTI